MGPTFGKLHVARRSNNNRKLQQLSRSQTNARSGRIEELSETNSNKSAGSTGCPSAAAAVAFAKHGGSIRRNHGSGNNGCPYVSKSISLNFQAIARNNKRDNNNKSPPPDLSMYTFSIEEIRMLRDSFEILKEERCELSRTMVHGVNSGVPGALGVYQKARDRLGNDWIFMNIGMIVLSGVERCLLRVNSPYHLRDTVRRILTSHTLKYGVPFEMMAPVVQATYGIFRFEFLRLCHDPPILAEAADEHATDECALCSTWTRFFDLLVIQFQQPL